MPGEQLPPVVATMEGDDSEFLAMLDRDVAALRAAAGEIDGLLAGLDLGAALADSMRGANLGTINTDELAQGLSEGLAGVGAALGQDVGSELTDAVRAEGVQAGAALAEGVAEGASGAGEAIGQDLTAGLTGEASNAGSRAGESLSESLAGAVAGVGQDVASQVDAGLGSLPGRFAAIGADAGHAMTASLEGALLGLTGAAVGAAAALGGIGAAIEARLADVLMQAGQSAGPSLAFGISAGAADDAGRAAAAVAIAVEASLSDSLTQAGDAAGGSLMAGVEAGAASSAGAAAVAIGESLQATLEDQMTLLGQAGGDAFNAGLGNATGGAGGGGEQGGAAFIDFKSAETEVEQQAEQLGQLAERTFRIAAGGTYSASGQQIPYGGKLEPDQLLGLGQQEQQDPFVPDLASGQGAWTRASKIGAQQAAEEAWLAYGDELSGLVVPPDRFLEMTDPGIALWKENIAAQAEASGEGFVHAFAAAMTMGMAGIDWGALSDAQAAALNEAMRGTITAGATEAEAEAAAAGTSVGETMVQQVVETTAQLPEIAAQRGRSVAGAFMFALGEAKGAIAETFSMENLTAEFADDPAWQATMDKARALGAGVKDAFSAVGQDIRQEFAEDPQWQARMAEVRALADATVGGIKSAYGAVSDVAGAAVEGARTAFGAIGDFGAAMVAREKEAVAALGDLGPALVDRVRGAFEALSAYAAENGDTIGGRFAGALTDSMSAFTGSLSAIGESVRIVFSSASDQAAQAGAEAGAAFDLALAEGLAQSEPEALAAVQELQAQVGAALSAGDAELAQSLISRLDTIQLAANQALGGALDGAGNELNAVFESIYQRGALLSDNLATAMANALGGIEADTSRFTTTELAQWNEFFAALEERGTEAAYQLAVTMGSLQGKDLLAMGVGSTGLPMGQAASETEAVAGSLGNVEKAASGATSAFGGLSSMMFGPLGMAFFMIQPLLSSLPGLFSSSAASASDFTQVVQQDSGAVGDNTAATIQSTLAKSNLSAISQQLGLSQAQLIEYAAGEASVQQTVTQAYNQQVEALTKAADARANVTTKEHAGTSGPDAQLVNLEQQKQYLDEVTSAVQQAVQADAENSAALLAAEQTTAIYTAAVGALGQAQLLQVQQTKMQNQATAEYGNQVLFAESSTSYMTAAMNASAASSRESALTNAYASVGLLNLGSSQTELNAQLAASEASYAEATSGAGAYNSMLSALNGTTNTLLGSEASFTTTLDGLTTAVKSNGESLDVNTGKGAANIQVVTQIATAAQAAAAAVYQNDIANGNAAKAYQDANDKLEQEKTAFEQAGDKAQLNKTQVEQLANELFKLPPSIKVDADIDPALSSAYGLVRRINTLVGTITVTEDVSGATLGNVHGVTAAKASGGPVAAGNIYKVNESGQEGYFIPPENGYIIPNDQFTAISAGAGAAGGYTGGASSGGGGQAPQVTVHVYLDSREIAAETRAEAQWYKAHNGTTGYT